MSTTRFKVFHGIAQCRSAMPRAGTSSVIITTGSVDSERDRMMQDQLQFRVPLRVLVNHDHRSLPVGQVDTHADITRSGDKTIASFRWLEGDDRADQVRNVFDQGMLGASIGMTV